MNFHNKAQRRKRVGACMETLDQIAILFLLNYGAVCLFFTVAANLASGAEAQADPPEPHQTAHFIPREVFREPTETMPAPTEPTEPETVPPSPEPVSLGEFIVTAYCACEACCGKSPDDPWYGITATGTTATQGRTVAVDPDVIPLGSVVYFRGSDGLETGFVAEDTGGAIRENRIDLYFDSHADALEWGVKHREVWTMPEG